MAQHVRAGQSRVQPRVGVRETNCAADHRRTDALTPWRAMVNEERPHDSLGTTATEIVSKSTGDPRRIGRQLPRRPFPRANAMRGESSGCHRLHNQLALRLASFLVRHREHVHQGLVPEDYVRRLSYRGQEVALQSENKGYRFQLTPPVPVTVLDGDARGNAKAVKRPVPLVVAP